MQTKKSAGTNPRFLKFNWFGSRFLQFQFVLNQFGLNIVSKILNDVTHNLKAIYEIIL